MNDEIRTAIAEANDEYLMHVGIGHDENPPGRGSGRYAFGSGDNPFQRDYSILAADKEMRKQGLSEKEIAIGLGYKSTDEYRKAKAVLSGQQKLELAEICPALKAKGYSNVEIAKKVGQTEGSVRNYLRQDRELQTTKTNNVADALKRECDAKRYIDVGIGVELEIANGITNNRKNNALEQLVQQGYKIHEIRVKQLGTGENTVVKVLGAPDTEWGEVAKDHSLIKPFVSYAENDGESVRGLLPIQSIDSKRVFIRYAEKGGEDNDGLVEIRPGVEDLSLGRSLYSQVRIGVDGTHFMKGMAVYSNDVPKGYDCIYNTNKKEGTDKYDVFKPMERKEDGSIDMDNPFGAAIKAGREGTLVAGGQSYCLDKDGNPTDKLRAINKIYDQGDWGKWSKTISAQMLSKQQLPLIKRQLELTYKDRKTEYDEIMALDNPTIKRKLLESFAEDCDAAAVHLKAKAFPGQASYAIVPAPSLRDDQVFAPNFPEGTKLALIRYPHAGTFEIPILTVTHRNKEAESRISRNAPDAICINKHVADRMSGADFDGDTVVCIPTTHTNIQSTPYLRELIGFNTKQYKFADPKAKGLSEQNKQREMGKITNLIADMQLKGAKEEEIARAVKHSMVIIDAVKHHLDYKQSEKDNNIAQLKKIYQGRGEDAEGSGAGTLITRAKSPVYIKERKFGSIPDKDDPSKSHYRVDPDTGKLIYTNTNRKLRFKEPTKDDPDRVVERDAVEKVKRMEIVDDASELFSSKSNPHPKEVAYGNYANRMKDLANMARLAALRTPRLKRDPEMAKKYKQEVDELNAALYIAEKNAPRERYAQIIAGANYKSIMNDHPEYKEDGNKKKRIKGQCLDAARRRVGAGKQRIDITPAQWEAIQNGAISDSKLQRILNNADNDKVRKMATPRNDRVINASRRALAKEMAAHGYSNADIAERLGISASSVSNIINE